MKTKIIVLIMLFGIMIYSKAQQIPNAGFENWTNLSLNEWQTNSCPFCDSPYNRYIVIQDSDACQGTFSAKFIFNNVFYAWAETKFASDIHPVNLFACVKSKIQDGDSVKIDVTILYKSKIVDEGHWLQKSTISDFQIITIPISQKSEFADSLDIKISGGNKVNTDLFADNLSFTTISAIKVYEIEKSWSINPNPFNDFTLLKFKNENLEKHILKIYNTNGQLMQTNDKIYTDWVKIEKENLTSGFYFFRLYNYNKIVASGKLMIK